MSPRAKQQLYYSLAQLIRAGISFPRALEKLSTTARGSVRRNVVRIRHHLEAGHTVAEACAAAGLGATEAAVLSAVERSGALDRGLEQLAQYFGALASARGRVLAKMAYPVFVLVLAALLLNLPVLVQRGLPDYGNAVVQIPWWAVALFGFVIAIFALARAARYSALTEALLSFTPFGAMRKAFAMARFCLVYDLQLSAGINTLDALHAAGEAAQSPVVGRAVAAMLPQIRAGSQVGPLLAASGAFPADIAEGVIVGEETGSLGTELRRLAAAESERAFRWLDTLSEWLPRLFYVGVLIYVGAKIVAVFKGYLDVLQSIGEP